MIVKCPQCDTGFNIPSSKVPEKGAKMRCSNCDHMFRVRVSASQTPEIFYHGTDNAPDTNPVADPATRDVGDLFSEPDDSTHFGVGHGTSSKTSAVPPPAIVNTGIGGTQMGRAGASSKKPSPKTLPAWGDLKIPEPNAKPQTTPTPKVKTAQVPRRTAILTPVHSEAQLHTDLTVDFPKPSPEVAPAIGNRSGIDLFDGDNDSSKVPAFEEKNDPFAGAFDEEDFGGGALSNDNLFGSFDDNLSTQESSPVQVIERVVIVQSEMPSLQSSMPNANPFQGLTAELQAIPEPEQQGTADFMVPDSTPEDAELFFDIEPDPTSVAIDDGPVFDPNLGVIDIEPKIELQKIEPVRKQRRVESKVRREQPKIELDHPAPRNEPKAVASRPETFAKKKSNDVGGNSFRRAVDTFFIAVIIVNVFVLFMASQSAWIFDFGNPLHMLEVAFEGKPYAPSDDAKKFLGIALDPESSGDTPAEEPALEKEPPTE